MPKNTRIVFEDEDPALKPEELSSPANPKKKKKPTKLSYEDNSILSQEEISTPKIKKSKKLKREQADDNIKDEFSELPELNLDEILNDGNADVKLKKTKKHKVKEEVTKEEEEEEVPKKRRRSSKNH